MAIIDKEIPTQGFEIVRDAIGAILKTELESQKALKGFNEPLNIYIERSTPFKISETLMINVLLSSANYSQVHEAGVHGSTEYYIDIYTTAKSTDENVGGYNSSVRRDAFTGMCRAILQSHLYSTLGMPGGLIMGTYVQSFNNFEPVNAQDSSFVKMSRLVFNVRLNENNSLWSGVLLESNFTDVKLNNTTKGYKYELKN